MARRTWQDMLFGAGLMVLALCLVVVAAPLTSKNGISNAVNRAALRVFRGGTSRTGTWIVAVEACLSWLSAPLRPDIPEAKKVLADLVGSQWNREAANRSLDTVDAIPVPWRVIQRPGAIDHPNNLSAASLEMEGFSYDANALAEKFRRWGAVAWWCLGDFGTGKTTLAVQMVQRLLDLRPDHQNEPVPVLLPMVRPSSPARLDRLAAGGRIPCITCREPGTWCTKSPRGRWSHPAGAGRPRRAAPSRCRARRSVR